VLDGAPAATHFEDGQSTEPEDQERCADTNSIRTAEADSRKRVLDDQSRSKRVRDQRELGRARLLVFVIEDFKSRLLSDPGLDGSRGNSGVFAPENLGAVLELLIDW
jgi:hypothetical protein